MHACLLQIQTLSHPEFPPDLLLLIDPPSPSFD